MFLITTQTIYHPAHLTVLLAQSSHYIIFSIAQSRNRIQISNRREELLVSQFNNHSFLLIVLSLLSLQICVSGFWSLFFLMCRRSPCLLNKSLEQWPPKAICNTSNRERVGDQKAQNGKVVHQQPANDSITLRGIIPRSSIIKAKLSCQIQTKLWT